MGTTYPAGQRPFRSPFGTLYAGSRLISDPARDQVGQIQALADLAFETGQTVDARGMELGFGAPGLNIRSKWIGGFFHALYTGVTDYYTSWNVGANELDIIEVEYDQPTAYLLNVTGATSLDGTTLSVTVEEDFTGADAVGWVNGDHANGWQLSIADHQFNNKAITITGQHTFTVTGTFTIGSSTPTSRGAFTGKIRVPGKPAFYVQQREDIDTLGCKVHSSLATGIFYQQVIGGRIQGNDMSMCRADSIMHCNSTTLDGCEDIQTSDNTITFPGDDATSVVAYVGSGGTNKNIIVSNTIVRKGYGDNSATALMGVGGGLRVSGGSRVTFRGSRRTDCFSACQISTDGTYNTYAPIDVLFDDLMSDTVGSVANSQGSVKIVGTTARPAQNITLTNVKDRNVRYRPFFTTGNGVGAISNLKVRDYYLYNGGELTDTDASTGSQPSWSIDCVAGMTAYDITIEETGGQGMGFGTNNSGKLSLQELQFNAINRNGAASTDVIQFTSPVNYNLVEIGNITLDSQAGIGGTYTAERLLEVAGTAPNADVFQFIAGTVQRSYATITTPVPFFGAFSNTMFTERLLAFNNVAVVNAQTLGDNALNGTTQRQSTRTFIATRCLITRASGAFNTDCQLGIYSTTGGGGTLIFATTPGASELAGLTGANTVVEIPLQNLAVLSSLPIQCRITTANGAALTVSVQIYGYFQ